MQLSQMTQMQTMQAYNQAQYQNQQYMTMAQPAMFPQQQIMDEGEDQDQSQDFDENELTKKQKDELKKSKKKS